MSCTLSTLFTQGESGANAPTCGKGTGLSAPHTAGYEGIFGQMLPGFALDTPSPLMLRSLLDSNVLTQKSGNAHPLFLHYSETQGPRLHSGISRNSHFKNTLFLMGPVCYGEGTHVGTARVIIQEWPKKIFL